MLGQPALSNMEPYAAIGVTILIVLAVIVGMMVVAHVLGPKRHGPIKDSPYESGVPVVGDTQRRFHIPFFIVAVLFLLFDVEVVFLWPWAPVFYKAAVGGQTIGNPGVGKGFLLAEMAVFFGILLVGYVYAWRKGVFRWD